MEEKKYRRAIRNPYTRYQGYNCFACAPDNSHGLKMEFYEEGDQVCCEWSPQPHFQGYKNVLHGGIQATLMDELASWLIQVKLKTGGVTTTMTQKFLKPVFINNGNILLKASVKEIRKRNVEVKVDLFDATGALCSEGLVTYLIFPEEYARKALYYPGYESFFQD